MVYWLSTVTATIATRLSIDPMYHTVPVEIHSVYRLCSVHIKPGRKRGVQTSNKSHIRFDGSVVTQGCELCSGRAISGKELRTTEIVDKVGSVTT